MLNLLGAVVVLLGCALLAAPLVKQHLRGKQRRLEIEQEDRELKAELAAKYPSVELAGAPIGLNPVELVTATTFEPPPDVVEKLKSLYKQLSLRDLEAHRRALDEVVFEVYR